MTGPVSRQIWANSNTESLDEYYLERITRSSRSAREHYLFAPVIAYAAARHPHRTIILESF